MLAYTYVKKGVFALEEKPRPAIQDSRDAIVRVTLGSICTSDLHIKHGSVPRAVPGITVGHEMVGVVKETGTAITKVKPGDRVIYGKYTGTEIKYEGEKYLVINADDIIAIVKD